MRYSQHAIHLLYPLECLTALCQTAVTSTVCNGLQLISRHKQSTLSGSEVVKFVCVVELWSNLRSSHQQLPLCPPSPCSFDPLRS